MKPFFLYMSAGLLFLYTLYIGPELGVSKQFVLSDRIIIGFIVSFLAAANISLFRKKVAAVIGLVAFSPALIWTILTAIKTAASLGFFQIPFFIVFALLLLLGCAVFYSIACIFFIKQMKWNTKSQVIYILRLILIGIQICIFWVIMNQS